MVHPQWSPSNSKRLLTQDRTQTTAPLLLFVSIPSPRGLSQGTLLGRQVCTGETWLPLGIHREDLACSGVSCLGQKARDREEWSGRDFQAPLLVLNRLQAK